MTADYTIEATPGQVAAIERDGFLVVVGPRTEVTSGPQHEAALALAAPGATMTMTVPVPTTKPCPECGGSGCSELTVADYEAAGIRIDLDDTDLGTPEYADDCPDCTDGRVPIVVEVVVPERECPDHERSFLTNLCTTCGSDSEIGTIPARTLLRGTAEAVPVVADSCPANTHMFLGRAGVHLCGRRSDGMWLWVVTHHFADVPRPEVGDTAWIIRGEGS